MTYLLVQPSVVSGTISLPPSKSHTMRALLFAAMAVGQSTIKNVLASPDTDAMVRALSLLGAQVIREGCSCQVQGVAGRPTVPDAVIDAGNSGQVLRFVAAFAALADGYSVFTGDASLRTRRTVQPLIDGLQQLGATAFSTRANGFAPLVVGGGLQSGRCLIKDGADSQPISALLMAAAYVSGVTEILVENSGEIPWIDLTLMWLQKQGVSVQTENYHRYLVQGSPLKPSFTYEVPGDFSSAAFPLVAAAVTGSSLTLEGADVKDVQGDKKVLDILKEMGVKIQMDETAISLSSSGQLQGGDWDVSYLIDAVPILAVAGCFAAGRTRLYNAGMARNKESDRLASICKELKKMGACIEEYEEELRIFPSSLAGAELDSHSDHRIAMALAVAGMNAKGTTRINGTSCISKSYPNFVNEFRQLGVCIEEVAPV